MNAIELGFQCGIGSRECIDNAAGPGEVLLLAIGVPVRWGTREDAAEVGDFVSKFYALGALRLLRSVGHLETLAFGFREGLVIGDFHDETRDVGAELLFEFVASYPGIFNDVVK